jgi:hypothetical protein
MTDLIDQARSGSAVREYVFNQKVMGIGLAAGTLLMPMMFIALALPLSESVRLVVVTTVVTLSLLSYSAAVLSYVSGMRSALESMRSADRMLQMYRTRQYRMIVRDCIVVAISVLVIGWLVWKLADTFAPLDTSDDDSNIMAATYCMLWAGAVVGCGVIVHRCLRHIRRIRASLHDLFS